MDFLRAIWGDDRPHLFGELRFIREGKVYQDWHPLTDQGLMEAEASAWDLNQAGWDSYYGVLPRIREGGKAEDVYQATTILWSDIDSKKYGEDGSQVAKEAALAALRRPALSPQIIVDSGGGYHAYWVLDREVGLEWASIIMKGIAKEVDGDHVQDAPRVLRVPGTFNWKRIPARPARILRFDLTHRYRPSDFNDYVPTPQAPRQHTARTHEGELVPEWMADLIVNGAPKGERSEAAFKVCIWLLRYGWQPDEIRQIFVSHPDGIGAKYVERGDRWLDYTITAAERAR